MSEKKRVFIMSHSLELGGAERSLIGLLDAFDTAVYDVDLFLMRQQGELMKYIPSGINLLPQVNAYTVLARPMQKTLLEGHVILTFARVIGKLFAKKYEQKHDYADSGVALEYSHKYTKRFMPKIQSGVKYDLAISFLTPHYFVADKVEAKQKIAWIHTDYRNLQINRESELKMWSEYDHIISISNDVTRGFVDKFPELGDKIILIENILPQKLIEVQTKEFNVEKEMPNKGIKLLSIGRYCFAKNFDNIPEICRTLAEDGWDVYWYIIGFGADEQLIKDKIREFHVENRVILLGKKENPYPYIDACDVYVQPSRYEGKSVTVREAQMFGKPVIITNYATANSQLEDGVDGIIVPMENGACAKQISSLLRNVQQLENLRTNCARRDYANKEAITKVYEIINMMEGE